jgi:hypothetical protein
VLAKIDFGVHRSCVGLIGQLQPERLVEVELLLWICVAQSGDKIAELVEDAFEVRGSQSQDLIVVW